MGEWLRLFINICTHCILSNIIKSLSLIDLINLVLKARRTTILASTKINIRLSIKKNLFWDCIDPSQIPKNEEENSFFSFVSTYQTFLSSNTSQQPYGIKEYLIMLAGPITTFSKLKPTSLIYIAIWTRTNLTL